MATITHAKPWQGDRAARLHQAFQQVATAVEIEGAKIEPTLQALAVQLNGTELKGGKRLKASWRNLRTFYYVWRSNGRNAKALLPGYKSPKHVLRLPDELTTEIQRRASVTTGGRDKNGNGPEAAQIHADLEREWKAGKSIKGLGTWQEWWLANRPALPLPNIPPDFPWSVKTVTRRIGSKVVRRTGNIGFAAANSLVPSMQRDYSKLRRCEVYTLDDVRLDVVALDELIGKPVRITCYIIMEVASRCIPGFVLKPSDAIKAEDVDELIAHVLQSEAYGVGDGYVTHILFERGHVACTDAAQRWMEAASEGAIKVHRTSMDGGIRWAGSAIDKASGHSAGKAVVESFMKNLHRRLGHLPGQRGNNYKNQPSNLGFGDKSGKDPSKSSKDTLVAQTELLAQFKLTAMAQGLKVDLDFPMLTVSQLRAEVAAAIAAHNTERGHSMQGFAKVTEAEVIPGVWKEIGI